MTKKWDLETSNAKNGAQNRNLHEKLSNTGPIEKFDYGQSQRSTVKVNDQRSGQSQQSTADVCWRGSVMSP